MSLVKPKLFFLILILLPFFKPVGLAYYSSVNLIFQIWKILSIMFLIFWFIFSKWHSYRLKIRLKGETGLILFWIIYIFNSILSRNNFKDILNAAITSIILLWIIGYASNREWKIILLKTLVYIFKIYIILHLISIVIVRAGFIIFEPLENDYTYFLGTDNYSSFAVYPMLGIILFYASLKNNNKIGATNLGLVCLVVLSYLYVGSVTAAMAGMAFVVFLLVQRYWEHILQIFNIKIVFILFLIVFLLIHYGKIQLLFSFLLENVLNKSVTLNSRTYIWDCAINLIKSKPFLGYGTFSQLQIDSYILYGTTHAHNMLLELLMRTGIVGTSGYLWFLTGYVKSNKKQSLLKKPSSILVVTLLVQMILYFMDFYVNFSFFYCFMGVLYSAENFYIKQK